MEILCPGSPGFTVQRLEQRSQYEIGPHGESVHWEALDEDLSLESFFDFKRELNYAAI